MLKGSFDGFLELDDYAANAGEPPKDGDSFDVVDSPNAVVQSL